MSLQTAIGGHRAGKVYAIGPLEPSWANDQPITFWICLLLILYQTDGWEIWGNVSSWRAGPPSNVSHPNLQRSHLWKTSDAPEGTGLCTSRCAASGVSFNLCRKWEESIGAWMCNDCDAAFEHVHEEDRRCITQVFKVRVTRLRRGRVPVLQPILKQVLRTLSIDIGIPSPATLFLDMFFFFPSSPSTFSAPWETAKPLSVAKKVQQTE